MLTFCYPFDISIVREFAFLREVVSTRCQQPPHGRPIIPPGELIAYRGFGDGPFVCYYLHLATDYRQTNPMSLSSYERIIDPRTIAESETLPATGRKASRAALKLLRSRYHRQLDAGRLPAYRTRIARMLGMS